MMNYYVLQKMDYVLTSATKFLSSKKPTTGSTEKTIRVVLVSFLSLIAIFNGKFIICNGKFIIYNNGKFINFDGIKWD